jgi:hypothetical protein
MKHSKMIQYGVLVLALAGLVACGKKGADGASVNAGRDQRALGSPNLPTGQGGTVGSQSALINFSTGQAAQMKETVQVLVSPTLDAGSVGDINEVRVAGNVGVQSSGQVLQDSVVELVIRDSFTGTAEDGSVIEPIVIRIRGGTGTAVGYNANLQFTDEYGTVTVKGTYNATTFNGTVEFQNRKSVTLNGKNLSGGTLGSFSIPTCAFFRCM